MWLISHLATDYFLGYSFFGTWNNTDKYILGCAEKMVHAMIREMPMHASRWDFMESKLQTIESCLSTRLLMVYMLFVAHSQTPRISCLLSTETCCCHQSHQKGASIQFCKNFTAIMLDDMTIVGSFSLRAWIILWNVYLAAFAVWVDIAKTGCNWFLWSSNLAESQELPDREDGMPVEAPNPSNSWKSTKGALRVQLTSLSVKKPINEVSCISWQLHPTSRSTDVHSLIVIRGIGWETLISVCAILWQRLKFQVIQKGWW